MVGCAESLGFGQNHQHLVCIGETDPSTFPYVLETGENATYSHQLWFTAGQSSPLSAAIIVIVLGAWTQWPVNWSMYYCFFKVGPIRSDFIFGLFWGFVFPGIIVPATGTYAGRDAFVWMKIYSLVMFSSTLLFFKYVVAGNGTIGNTHHADGFSSWLQTLLLHGMLAINVVEAGVWEIAVLAFKPYNYINGFCGLFLAFVMFTYSFKYGTGIAEEQNGKIRQLRGNLSPLYVLAYTAWNVAYNANYHPEKNTYYAWITLAVPLIASLFGIDWLECRAHTLLHAATIRVFPWGGNGPMVATLGLWQSLAISDEWRYFWTILGLVLCLAVGFESVWIATGKEFIKIPLMNYDMDVQHPEGEGRLLELWREYRTGGLSAVRARMKKVRAVERTQIVPVEK